MVGRYEDVIHVARCHCGHRSDRAFYKLVVIIVQGQHGAAYLEGVAVDRPSRKPRDFSKPA